MSDAHGAQSRRRARRALMCGAVLLLLGWAARPLEAQQEAACQVAATVAVNVRSGPGVADYGVIGAMPQGAAWEALGRSAAGDWYAVAYRGGAGWVAASVAEPRGACGDLPVIAAPARPAAFDLLETAPVLPAVGEHVRAIFARGQARAGVRPDPHVFAKVGDCNVESNFFLFPLDYGMYRLGPYEALRPTVEFFAGSFAAPSVAARAGYTSFSLLDPLLANPESCQAGESPLACEYRRMNPAAALIMVGANDARYLTLDEFNRSMREVVEATLEADIIPVLSTFTARTDARWEQSLAVNAALVAISREYDVPLINFWRAARDLPGFGLIERSTRLTHGWQPGDSVRVDLDAGQAATWGHALHNLLALQTLDMLRREVLEAGG
ncbi:MAG: SH3 domain-containing protein [Anaerolineae bacterium]|nr:SH3 domain-containing protein [Anaerolineae bacterium]